MAEHPTELVLDLRTLAYEIENLRYDRAAEFVGHLAAAFSGRVKHDEQAGRKRLAMQLNRIQAKLWDAKRAINEAWLLCQPHMQESDE